MLATALRAIMARTNDYLVRKFLFDVNNVDIMCITHLILSSNQVRNKNVQIRKRKRVFLFKLFEIF